MGTGVIAIGMWSLLSPSDPPRCDRPIRQISKILFNSPECALRFTADRAFVGQGAASGAAPTLPRPLPMLGRLAIEPHQEDAVPKKQRPDEIRRQIGGRPAWYPRRFARIQEL